MSARYVHGHHESVMRSHRWRTAANSAGHLLPHLREGMRLLDLGAGAGTITADLADAVAPGGVVATEVSAAVLSTTRQAVADRSNVTLEVADAHALPFADGSFDVTHAHQVLQHLDDPVRALREMARVTRPGGLVAARDADYAAMAWHPESPGLDRWREVYRLTARAAGGEPDAGRRLLAWSRAAGLTDVEVGAETWCFARAEDRRWWGRTWAARAVTSTFAEEARAQGFGADELDRISQAWLRWSEDPDGWFLVPHGWVLARV